MSDGAKTGMEERIKQILVFINETPRVLSLLYDLGLLPEQLSRTSREWAIMCQLVDAELRATEALKVAGEALRFIEREARELDSSGDEIGAKQMRAFASERHAALERIRKP